MRPPPAKKKKQGNMTGDQWAEAHGAAWQQFLQEKLKKCECTNPRTSLSNRKMALKEDDGEGIMPGEPAACLLCFAPVDLEVRRLPREWGLPLACSLPAASPLHAPVLPYGVRRRSCSGRAPDP